MNIKTQTPLTAIADGGSTKIDWAIIDPHGEPVDRFDSPGVNPAVMDSSAIVQELSGLREKLGEVSVLHFYGAGCLPELQESTARLLESALGVNSVTVNTDLLGAARGLLGRRSGIACILGTGSNSCSYNGDTITANTPSLGFILGDEGSGGSLGKEFVSDLLKGVLPQQMKQEFFTRYSLDQAEIIRRVYRSPSPNRFLASFAPFIAEKRNHPRVRSFLINAFRRFICRNLTTYPQFPSAALNFCGSIAVNFEEELREAAHAEGAHIAKIEKSPMKGLIQFHST